MKNVSLPQSWIECEFSELVEYITSGSRDWSKYYSDTGANFIRTQDINTDSLDLSRVAKVKLPDKVEGKRTLVHKGDILITITGANVGKCAHVSTNIEESYVSQSVALVRPVDKSLSIFFQFLLISSDGEKTKLQNKAYGMGRPVLNLSNIRELRIGLPPYAEQKQIAAKLDELLAQVDTLKTRLDSIPKILKRFRQSVLAAAVSGKLTEEWRLGNKVEKFSFSAIEISEFRGEELELLPNTWQWLRFDDVAEVASNLQDPADTPDAIHIAPNHIESETGQLLEYTTVAKDNVKSAKNRFFNGQILYSKIRPYLNKVVLAKFDGLCSADMYPINAKIDSKYLFRWILCCQFTDWASNAGSRSVLPKINQKSLNEIPVPTPPLKEQTQIVQQVEKLFTFADKIEQSVNQAQKRVNNLTQSILAKAFRGELTADWREQNPELISGENSAESLLAKIKTEREAMTVSKGKAAKKKRVVKKKKAVL